MIKKIISAIISIFLAYAIIRLLLWTLGVIWNIMLFIAVIVLAGVIYFAISRIFKRKE